MITSWQNSVVLIKSNDPCEKSFGTGFVIFKDGHYTYFLTCAHVVKEIGTEKLLVSGFQAKVVASGSEENTDLAVLRIEGLFPSPMLPFYALCEEGDSFSTSGFQLTTKNHVLRLLHGTLGKQVRLEGKELAGRVKAWDLEITDKDPLYEGYSGSPVINAQNQVIGVVSTLQGEGKRGMAISIDTLEMIWIEMPLKYVYVLDHFERRNQLAKQVITNYTQTLLTADIIDDLMGAVIPFRGTEARISSLSVKSLLVYHPMIKDLAKVFTAPSDIITQKDVDQVTASSAIIESGTELVIEYLFSEFDRAFFCEILDKLLEGVRNAYATSATEVILRLAELFSKTPMYRPPYKWPDNWRLSFQTALTWQVGITVALFFFNGQEWFDSNKERTYLAAARNIGPLLLTPGTKERINTLPHLLKIYQPMWEKNVKGMLQIIHSVKRVHPFLSTYEIGSLLKENGYPKDALAEALKRVEMP